MSHDCGHRLIGSEMWRGDFYATSQGHSTLGDQTAFSCGVADEGDPWQTGKPAAISS